MQKISNIILILSLILNIILSIILIKHSEDSKDYQIQIDSLESIIEELNNKRDSIRLEIDTVYNELEKVKIQYEKDSTIIINNSIRDDYLFFTRYLENYKLNSIDNISAIEGD